MERYMTMMMAILMTALVGFTVFVLVFLVIALWSTGVKAHSWYELECCDTRDCEPIPADQVKVTPEGYVTPDGQLIPFASARVSADRDYHWCKYQKNSTAVIWPHEKRACFYAPAGGM